MHTLRRRRINNAAGRPVLLRSPPWPPLRMYVLTIETERGAVAKGAGSHRKRRCARGVREQSCKGCLRAGASFCRCKPNFRGLGVYVPRSVDWHPASRCII